MKDGGKQTQNSTSRQTQSSTSNITGKVTPSAPDWVSTAIQDALKRVSGVTSANPQSFVAGSNPALDSAMARIGGLNGLPEATRGALDAASYVMAANAPQIGQAARANGFINDYMTPYRDQVVSSALADFDADRGDARAQFDLDNAEAFGGSGAFLGKAALEDKLARGRATLESGLLSDAFKTALGAAENDAGRLQSTKELNANLRSQHMDRALSAARSLQDIVDASDANARANIGAQTGIGQIMRQIEAEQKAAPLNLAAFGTDNLPALLANFFGEDRTGTTNTTGTGTTNSTGTAKDTKGTGEAIGDILAIAAMFASDAAIKRDIRLLGRRSDGLGLYLFRYLWSDLLHLGVMAQEVLKVKPEAVARHPAAGFLMVNYAAI